MNDVKKQCDGVTASYESKYEDYEKKLKEAASAGWIAFLIGGRQAEGEKVESLEMVRFKTGDALTYFIFTKDDVEKYFNSHLN
jgi:hypothetical protein